MNRTTKSTKKKRPARVFKPRKLDLQALELLRKLDQNQMWCVIRAWEQTLPHLVEFSRKDRSSGNAAWTIQRLVPVLATLIPFDLDPLGKAIVQAVADGVFDVKGRPFTNNKLEIRWAERAHAE